MIKLRVTAIAEIEVDPKHWAHLGTDLKPTTIASDVQRSLEQLEIPFDELAEKAKIEYKVGVL